MKFVSENFEETKFMTKSQMKIYCPHLHLRFSYPYSFVQKKIVNIL